MTKLVIIRHGQSETNIEGVFTGNLDVPLTDLGIRQAKCTAEYILSHYRVDCVYASDLCRAMVTAGAVAEPLGLRVTPERRLREIFAGQWEGLPFDRLTKEFSGYGIWLKDIGNAHPEGGESVAQLQSRALEAFREIAAAKDGKTVVIATHATPIRALMCHCLALPLSQMKEVPWTSNASVTTVNYDNGAFVLEEAGHDAHLADMASRFPANV